MKRPQSRQVAERISDLRQTRLELRLGDIAQPRGAQELCNVEHVLRDAGVLVGVKAMVAMRVDQAQRIPARCEIEVNSFNEWRLGIAREIDSRNPTVGDGGLIEQAARLPEILALDTCRHSGALGRRAKGARGATEQLLQPADQSQLESRR